MSGFKPGSALAPTAGAMTPDNKPAAPGLVEALQEIASMTYDPWTNGARAKEIAEKALSQPVPSAPEPSTLTTEALNEAWKRGYKVAQEEAALASSAPASAPEPSEAIAQLRHLIDDLVVTYQEDGLDRHMVRDGAGLLFSNFVGAIRRLLASLPASPEPATQGAAKPVHTDHPFQHWDRTCPACVLEASPPAPEPLTPAAGMSEWISVKDRLPPPDERVLFVDHSGGAYITLGYKREDDTDSRWWRDILNTDREGDPTDCFGVTHWMPLPALPTEKQGD